MKPIEAKLAGHRIKLANAPELPPHSVSVYDAEGNKPSHEMGQWGRILVLNQRSPQKFFFPGDPHLDSKDCDLDLFFRHLVRAKLEGRWIVLTGDLFDAMQGREDKRRDNGIALEQWRQLVNYAANALEPFQSNILAMGQGNHETKVLKYGQIDLLHELAHELHKRTGRWIPVMDYNWWIVNQVGRPSGTDVYITTKGIIWHGWGGHNRVGKAVNHNLYLQEMANYDYSVMGHTHSAYSLPTEYFDIVLGSKKVKAYETIKQRLGLRTGSYKLPNSGFAKEKGMGPSPRGGVALDLTWTEIPRGEVRSEAKKKSKTKEQNLEIYIPRRYRVIMESTFWS